MKVHNCLDCPMMLIKDGQIYRRRNCPDEMCDAMMDSPTEDDVKFFTTFHCDPRREEPPIDEIVRIWKKNVKPIMADAPKLI